MDIEEFELRKVAKRHNRRSISNELYNIVNSNISTIDQIENELFSYLKTELKREFVYVFNNQFKMWTLSANTNSSNTPLVMVHGLFGCIGIWLNNISELSRDRPLYAFDLLGFGRSSRPEFSDDPHMAETQFVESIEEWREKMGLEKFYLLGHSFGGFLTAAYALKYPQHVKKLILVDPWGFTKRSDDDNEPPLIKAIVKLTDYVSPLFALRATGLLGASVMKKVRPEFREYFRKTLGDSNLIYNYLYQCNVRYPNGEIGFMSLANGLKYAKYPMDKRMQALLDENTRIYFIYGENTRMEINAGHRVKSLLAQDQVSVKVIERTAHHLYAERSEAFNKYVNTIMKENEM